MSSDELNDPWDGPRIFAYGADSESAMKEVLEGRLAAVEAEPLSVISSRHPDGHPGPQRVAVIAEDTPQLQKQLMKAASGGSGRDLLRGEATAGPKIGFMFTGQGSQWSGMGRDLYGRYEVFRESLDACAVAAKDLLEVPLLAVLFESGHASWMDQTGYTQPCLYALECALTDLLASWGIKPDVVLGHSVGEYAAARSAGVFDMPTGMRLISGRGRLMQQLPAGGKMAALGMTAEAAAALIAGREKELSLAADNGPESIVVSGAGPAITEMVEGIERDGGKAKALTVSHAFHSPLMDPVLKPFEAFVGEHDLQPVQGGVTLISNVTASPVDGREATAAYWREHVRAPVRFRGQIEAAVEAGVDILVEVGPNPILTSMGMGCVAEDSPMGWAPLLRKGRDAPRSLARAVGALFVKGLDPDWKKLH